MPPCLRLSETAIVYIRKKERKERKSPSKLLSTGPQTTNQIPDCDIGAKVWFVNKTAEEVDVTCRPSEFDFEQER